MKPAAAVITGEVEALGNVWGLRDINCRPDGWITFRSQAGQIAWEPAIGTGVNVLRQASSHNSDRVVVCPIDQPWLIASISQSSLKPFKP